MEEALHPCQGASGHGMAIYMGKPTTNLSETERRNARLAEALRANLARRKARARAEGAAGDDDEEVNNS
jgi:hypothetical protein